MKIWKPVIAFFCLMLVAVVFGVAGRMGLIDAAMMKRGIGLVIGASALVVGNYLPKMRPLKSAPAERIGGLILVAAGIAFLTLFTFAPLDQARRVSSIIGFSALFLIAMSWLWQARSIRFRGRYTGSRQLAMSVLFAFLYVFATACVVYLFDKKPWIEWLETGFWVVYMGLFGALHWEQRNVCTTDGPEDHLPA
jgi:hypothetical protein